MDYSAEYVSPLGVITLASDGDHLNGLWLEGQKYFGSTLAVNAVPCHRLSVFSSVSAWLDRYFAGEHPDPTKIPLAPRGSDFHQLIWKLLLEIPYGSVTTYGALAKQAAVLLGRTSMSAQAVGGAVGHNPISILIPCHRVIGTGGSLTGYAGGIERKQFLLRLEGANFDLFTAPGQDSSLRTGLEETR